MTSGTSVSAADRARVIAGRLRRVDVAKLREMEFGIAETMDDLVQAYRILYDVYLDAGIVAAHPIAMRLRPQDLLPTTWTIFARLRGQIIAEVTLVGDSALGLPMEGSHAAEIGALRGRGARMAECSGLACVPAYRESGVTFLMFGQARAVLRRLGIPTMVMRVSPRLAPLYRDVLCCDVLGDTRCDPRLQDQAYTALSLDVEGCEARVRGTLAALRAGVDEVSRLLFEHAPALLTWPDNLVSPSRLAALAALVRAYPEVLASRSAAVQRHVYEALAPHLAWPTGSSPSVPIFAWPALGE